MQQLASNLFRLPKSEKERRILIALGFGYTFRVQVFYLTEKTHKVKLLFQADVKDTHLTTALQRMWNKIDRHSLPTRTNGVLRASAEIIKAPREDLLYRGASYTHCGKHNPRLYHGSGISPWEFEGADSSLFQVETGA